MIPVQNSFGKFLMNIQKLFQRKQTFMQFDVGLKTLQLLRNNFQCIVTRDNQPQSLVNAIYRLAFKPEAESALFLIDNEILKIPLVDIFMS